MRALVILAWRPKNFPHWKGRTASSGAGVPKAMSYDRVAAPYTAVHLASLLPRSWDVEVIHEMVRDVPLDADADVVFISTMDFCAPHARDLARHFRRRGAKVIVGGLYPTLDPAYFEGACDTVVVGEAEPVLPALLSDLENGELLPVYRSDRAADLADLPVPRYELVEPVFRIPQGYEATRGCPYTCSFCVLSKIRLPYRRRPIDNILRDLRAVPAGWSWLQRKVFGLWDNNLGVDRKYLAHLCEALVPLKRFWATETSLDTITPESARLMGRAGCRFVYIGLESLTDESLVSSNKRQNRVREYKERIGLLHDNGMIVMSIFLLGLDGDTKEYLERLPNLIEDVGVDIPVFSLAAPIYGTTYRRELEAAGRLLPGDLLDGMDGVHLVYRPSQIPADELELALGLCMTRAYEPRRVLRRMLRRVPDGFWATAASAFCNSFYMPYQRTIADAVRRRVEARGPWPGSKVEPSAAAQPTPRARRLPVTAGEAS